MKEYKRFLITSALPYANGPLHIGHLAGVYVPSDIYTRYLRAKGKDVISICGSDEHGVPITLKARNEGISPQDIVDKYSLLERKDELKLLNVKNEWRATCRNKVAPTIDYVHLSQFTGD